MLDIGKEKFQCLKPAPVNKVINPGKSPFHFVLLEVDLKEFRSAGAQNKTKSKSNHLERRVAMAFNPVGNAGALNLVHRGHLGLKGSLGKLRKQNHKCVKGLGSRHPH